MLLNPRYAKTSISENLLTLLTDFYLYRSR
jgi:hypothetical protein